MNRWACNHLASADSVGFAQFYVLCIECPYFLNCRLRFSAGISSMATDSERDLSLVNQGYQALRSRLILGQYAPGTKLKLDTLQQSLGFSSSPLREALNRLFAEGLVEVDEGRGFRAAQISTEELKELTHLRILLEGDALRDSMAHGDDEWEGRIVSAFHKLRLIEERIPESGESAAEVSSNAEEWSARHRDFHTALLSGSPHPRQLHMCGILYDQAERYRRFARQSPQPRKKSAEHKKLEEAVLSRDSDRALELLVAHIQRTADRVGAILEAEKRSSPTFGRA
jgi:GntR family carbon starvation induced transcriptional regulator